MGMMSVTILAKSRDDFPAIREETERRRQEYDTVIGENGYSLIYRNRPYDQEKNAAGMVTTSNRTWTRHAGSVSLSSSFY